MTAPTRQPQAAPTAATHAHPPLPAPPSRNPCLGTKTGGATSYTYDGLGRLIQPNLTYTGLGNTVAGDGTTTYVRDPGDGLVGVRSGGSGRYAWTDIHTDVVGEFTAAGTTLPGSVSYDPWGKILASGGLLGKLGYQSEWTDEGTGKVNMMSRWYDPETGAFDTRDTATNSGTPTSGAANRFAYAEGNPLTSTDTTGNAVDGAQSNLSRYFCKKSLGGGFQKIGYRI